MSLGRAASYLPCHQSTDLGDCAPTRDVTKRLRNRVLPSIKPLTCQGGVGDRLLSPTGRESRGWGLPLPFGAVRHIYRSQPKILPCLPFSTQLASLDLASNEIRRLVPRQSIDAFDSNPQGRIALLLSTPQAPRYALLPQGRTKAFDHDRMQLY
jgi:hypothetical protein